MKRIRMAVLMLAVIMLAFSGCGINENKAAKTKDKEILAQLNTMKEQNSRPKEMFDYLNQNITQLNKTSATEAVGLLVSTLEDYEAIYNEELFTSNYPDLMFQYFEFEFNYGKIDGIKEPELKTLLYDITLGGFMIANTEGTFTVVVDYEALKTFSEYIDEELKSYIDIMALRFNDPVAVDASIMVSPEELEKRILQMEEYIKGYGNEQREEVIMSMYQGYMMVYMSGTDNSAVFDYDTGALNPDMFKVFENAAAKYKDTVFGRIMNKYVALLKQEGFMNTEKVQDFILQIDVLAGEELAKAQ